MAVVAGASVLLASCSGAINESGPSGMPPVTGTNPPTGNPVNPSGTSECNPKYCTGPLTGL